MRFSVISVIEKKIFSIHNHMASMKNLNPYVIGSIMHTLQ
jgi:hypothetical protein